VAAGEVGRGTSVDHERTALEQAGEAIRRESLRKGQPAQQARTFLVDPLHLTEVFRRIRLARQHAVDELVFGHRPQPPVRQPLVAERALWERAEPLAARRPGPVARPDLKMIRERLEPLQAPEERARGVPHRAGDVGRLLEQVRAADVTDEHEVAADQRQRLGGDRGIGHEKAQVFRRVTRCVKRLDPNAADVEAVTVLQEDGARLLRERILPIGSSLG
jgi:hypothetical protein